MKRRGLLAVLIGVVCLYAAAQDPGAPLAAGFSARPYQVRPGRPVQFTEFSNGAIVSWLWDFGDGTTSSERNPVHVFAEPGTYDVTLTVSDGGTTVTAHMR